MNVPALIHAPELDGIGGLVRLSKDPLGLFEGARKWHGAFVRYRCFDK